MKLIKIKYKNEEHYSMVDDEDYEWLNISKWYLSYCKRYAYRNKKNGESKKTINISIHREIGRKYFDLINEQMDHIDGNGLNNQKSNLRKCNISQNRANTSKLDGKFSSRYKGVWFWKNRSEWCAKIEVNKTSISIGLFATEYDAAIAYDIKAKEFFGEFARINIENPNVDDLDRIKNILCSVSKLPFNKGRIGKTGYSGVSVNSKGQIRLRINNKVIKINLFGFKTINQAALCRDLIVYKITKSKYSLNYPNYDFHGNELEILNSSPKKFREIYNKL